MSRRTVFRASTGVGAGALLSGAVRHAAPAVRTSASQEALEKGSPGIRRGRDVDAGSSALYHWLEANV